MAKLNDSNRFAINSGKQGTAKMTILDKTERTSDANRSVDDHSTGPWDNPALSKFREWEPVWVDQCLEMSADPWTSGILPRKDIELISIAVNAACTNLSAEGIRLEQVLQILCRGHRQST